MHADADTLGVYQPRMVYMHLRDVTSWSTKLGNHKILVHFLQGIISYRNSCENVEIPAKVGKVVSLHHVLIIECSTRDY